MKKFKKVVSFITVLACFIQLFTVSTFAKQPAPVDPQIALNFDDPNDIFKMTGNRTGLNWLTPDLILGASWDRTSNFEGTVASSVSDTAIFGENDKVVKLSINETNLNNLKMSDTTKSVDKNVASNAFVWQFQNKNYKNSNDDSMWFTASNANMVHWSCTVMMDKKAGDFKFQESVLFDSDGNIKLANRNVNVAEWMPNKWYTVDMLFDGATRKGDLFINGECVSKGVEFYTSDKAGAMQQRALIRIDYRKNYKILDYNVYLNDISFGRYETGRTPVAVSMKSKHLYDGAYWYNGGNIVTVQKLVSETSVASGHSVKVIDSAHNIKEDTALIANGDFVVEYDENGSYVNMYEINAAGYTSTDAPNTKVSAEQYYDFSNPRDAYMFFVHNGWEENVYDVVSVESGVNGKTADDRVMKIALDSSLEDKTLDVYTDNRGNEWGSNGVYNGKKVKLEYQFMADSANCDVVVKSATPPGTQPTWFPVIATFKNDGTILAGDSNTLVGRWEPGKWYTVAVCFDFTDKISVSGSKYVLPATGEIYINGVKVENENIKFNSWEVEANIAPNLLRMNITPKTGADGKVMDCNVYFDNIKPFIYTSGANYKMAERTLVYAGDRLGNTLYVSDGATAEGVFGSISPGTATRSFEIYRKDGSSVSTGALQAGDYVVEKDSADKSVIFVYDIDFTEKAAVGYDSDKKAVTVRANSANDTVMDGVIYVGVYSGTMLEMLENAMVPSMTNKTYVYGEDIWERTADISAAQPTEGRTTKVFLWKAQSLEPVLDSPIIIR